MEKFFQAAHVAEEEKVQITSMYLTGDGKLWWRTKVEDEEESGRPQITTWETLKKDIKYQFLPSNASWMARESLKRLKQMGTMRDYVKDFSSLMLDRESGISLLLWQRLTVWWTTNLGILSLHRKPSQRETRRQNLRGRITRRQVGKI